MMEKYQENNVNRDMFYEEQKEQKIKGFQEEVRLAKQKKQMKKAVKKQIEKAKQLEDFETVEPEPTL